MSTGENRLTDFVKRVRPLLVSISESVVINKVINQGSGNQHFTPVINGKNVTTGTYLDVVGATVSHNGIVMDTTDVIVAYGTFTTPKDWTGTITVYSVFRTTTDPATKYFYMQNYCMHDEFTPNYVTNHGVGPSQIAQSASSVGAYKVLANSFTVSNQSVFRLSTARIATHANDTSPDDVYFLGWLFEYA